MKSFVLVFLAGCSVTDAPAFTTVDPVSWTARLDAEVGATPSGIAVSPEGDAIVTESLWSCSDGASAGVLRVDGATGESKRVDWTRGFATSALGGPAGFSALLATSSASDPWTFGLSFRQYADDGASFRTYEEKTVVPTEMSGDPSTFAVLRGYRSATGVSFTRAMGADGTLWETIDSADGSFVPTHVAVAGDQAVATLYNADGSWSLARYDQQGRIAGTQPFCSSLVAGDTDGTAFGAQIATDGSQVLALCAADATGRHAWSINDDVGEATWTAIGGIAVGAGEIVVTGTRDRVQADGSTIYEMWTRAYDVGGNLLWDEAHPPTDGFSAWSIGAAIGENGEVYVLGTEDTNEGAAPVVLRYR